MAPDSRVLFTTDGSAAAEAARPHARRLAKRLGATLYELTVEVPVPPEPPAALHERFGAGLDPFAPEPPPPGLAWEDAGPGHLRGITEHPAPATVTLMQADALDPAVLVMGTHGRRGVARTLMGSTAEHVLRRASCSVLLVPPGAEDRALEPVAVADDFSELGDRALVAAKRLAAGAGAPMTVLHVVEPPSAPSPYGIVLFPGYQTDLKLLAGRLEERAERAPGPDVPLSVRVAVGDPVAEIDGVVREVGAGVLVVGSHGRRGLRRFLLGSVAEGVVRRAPCPVLVVKAARPRPYPAPALLPGAEPLARAEWGPTFDRLSRQMAVAPRPWRLTAEVATPALGRRLTLDGVPVRGLTYDPTADALSVYAEGLEREVHPVQSIRVQPTAAGVPLRVEVVVHEEHRVLLTLDPPHRAP